MQTFEIKGEKFESKYTDEKALEIMRENIDNDFSKSLYSNAQKWGLSASQKAWVHKLVYDWENPKKATPSAKLERYNMERIFQLFKDAVANGLKYPKITFDLDGDIIQLSRAGNRAKYPGSVNVTDGGPFKANIWYGRIMFDKEDCVCKFFPSNKISDIVIEFLKEFSMDPEGIAKDYGIKTGRCCFCNRTLTTPESVAAGMGPVCKKKYNM